MSIRRLVGWFALVTTLALLTACAGAAQPADHDVAATRRSDVPADSPADVPGAAPTTVNPGSAAAPASTSTVGSVASVEMQRTPPPTTALPRTNATAAPPSVPVSTGVSAVASPAVGPRPANGSATSLGRCTLFPPSSYWYANVSTLPVHASSAAYVASIGATSGLKADFGSGLWNGGPIGIPYVVVGTGQPKVPVTFDYADESEPGPYPIPPDAPVEGGAASEGDRHILVVDQTDCRLYETWSTTPAGSGWHAGSGAVFDLGSNALRPDGWTSADAAGLPILPGLVRYDEIAAGRIDHAIRITVPRTQKSFIWPARHFASSRADVNLPPMGLWLRLRADYDTSGFAREAKIVLDALKQHGAIVADNGSAWYLSGAPDERWNNDALGTLRRVPGSAFDAVDTSSLPVSAGSGQVR